MIGELKSSNRKPIKPEQVSSQIGSQLIQYPYNITISIDVGMMIVIV
ncbi:hypothetical protein ACTXGW_08675 [Psychrobacter faecalis]